MKTEYKILKELSLLTIAQAGPKGCSEFRNEWNSLMLRMKEGGFVSNWLFGVGNPEGLTSFVCFIKWAEEKPKRIQWLIDKGFIERVEPKLKPCPFCGGKADGMSTFPSMGRVRCRVCEAYVHSSTPNGAIEAWNRRV